MQNCHFKGFSICEFFLELKMNMFFFGGGGVALNFSFSVMLQFFLFFWEYKHFLLLLPFLNCLQVYFLTIFQEMLGGTFYSQKFWFLKGGLLIKTSLRYWIIFPWWFHWFMEKSYYKIDNTWDFFLSNEFYRKRYWWCWKHFLDLFLVNQ